MSIEQFINKSDQELIDRVQTIRSQILDTVLEDGIPGNKDDRAFLLETMKDVDKAIFTKARIKQANKPVKIIETPPKSSLKFYLNIE